jgi:hypothetical protein
MLHSIFKTCSAENDGGSSAASESMHFNLFGVKTEIQISLVSRLSYSLSPQFSHHILFYKLLGRRA